MSATDIRKTAPGIALVAGAGGIIGRAVAHELLQQGWRVRSLGRRPVDGLDSLAADLNDPVATTQSLRQAADTTHVFYASLDPDPDLAVEAERNARMLGNLLDGLEAARAPLARVVIYQGFKIYGIHLGAKVRTPARESDPIHMPPNLYLAQEAELRQRAAGGNWNYVALRPDVIVGDVHGNPMNIALVVGVFIRPAGPVHGLPAAGTRQPVGSDQRRRIRRGVQRHQRRRLPLGAAVGRYRRPPRPTDGAADPADAGPTHG